MRDLLEEMAKASFAEHAAAYGAVVSWHELWEDDQVMFRCGAAAALKAAIGPLADDEHRITGCRPSPELDALQTALYKAVEMVPYGPCHQ